jgi:hypothetical protein
VSLPSSPRATGGLGRKDTGAVGELRYSDLRSSGLRGSRLAALIAAARRSSMSLVGSVHTFGSGDLLTLDGGSLLGLDPLELSFPRLTMGGTVPEHDVVLDGDRPLWSSKPRRRAPGGGFALRGAGAGAGAAGGGLGLGGADDECGVVQRGDEEPDEDEDSSDSARAGVGYSDCAAVLELCLNAAVDPLDPRHRETVNPLSQRLSAAVTELAPTLLNMLAWVADTAVRGEVVAGLHALATARRRNLELLRAGEGWRAALLRALQSVPKDRVFRDEASERMLQRLVELLVLSALPAALLFDDGDGQGFGENEASGRPALAPSVRLALVPDAAHRGAPAWWRSPHAARWLALQPSQPPLGQLLFEVAVMGGWGRCSVDLSRQLLSRACTAVLAKLARAGAEDGNEATALFLLRLVESFCLFMPGPEEALSGFSERKRALCLRRQSDSSAFLGSRRAGDSSRGGSRRGSEGSRSGG